MKVKNLNITEVKVTKTDSKTGDMAIQISFASESPAFTKLNIYDSYEDMADKIISESKKQKMPHDDDEDEILGGISIININNEDEIYERLPRGLLRLEQKFAKLKGTHTATDYIKMYSQFSTSEDIIFKK